MTVSMDGKTICSTGKMGSYDSPLHIISAQLCELGITFATQSIKGKSNEIPAVQQLISELDCRLHGCSRCTELSERNSKNHYPW